MKKIKQLLKVLFLPSILLCSCNKPNQLSLPKLYDSYTIKLTYEVFNHQNSDWKYKKKEIDFLSEEDKKFILDNYNEIASSSYDINHILFVGGYEKFYDITISKDERNIVNLSFYCANRVQMHIHYFSTGEYTGFYSDELNSEAFTSLCDFVVSKFKDSAS